MRKTGKFTFVALAILAVVGGVLTRGLVAFADGTVSVMVGNVAVPIGKTVGFTVNATNAAGRVDIVSNNPSIATVSETSIWMDTGINDEESQLITVTGVDVGSTTITVTATDVSSYDETTVTANYTINVTVYPDITEDDVLTVIDEYHMVLKEGGFTDITSRVNAGTAEKTFTHLNSGDTELSSNAITTGDKIVMVIAGTEYDYNISLTGDVNMDGLVTSADYIKIKKHIMGSETIAANSVAFYAADVDGNDSIASRDYIKIKLYIMNGGIWPAD